MVGLVALHAADALAYAPAGAVERDAAHDAAALGSGADTPASEVDTADAPEGLSALAPAEAEGGLIAAAEVAELDGALQAVDVVVSGLPEGEELPLIVHVLRPPHELIASVEARTDGAGRASLRVPFVAGAQVFAQAERGRAFFSESPVDLVEQDDALVVRLALPESTSDPSRVVISRLIMIVEPSEDHLMVTQLLTLGVDGSQHFEPAEGAAPLELPLFVGASALTLIEGDGRAEVRQSRLVHLGPVAPLGDPGLELDRIIVRYAIRTDNAAQVDLKLRFAQQVLDGVLLTPLATPFSRFPDLDVHLEAPICGAEEGGPCFLERVQRDPTGMIREHVKVRGLTGLHAPAGSELVVSSTGWPSRFPWERWGATLLGMIAALGGGAVFGREWLRTRDLRIGRERRMRALDAQRIDLLAQQIALEEALARGALLEQEYAHARASIVEELGLIHRRLRELGEESEARG